MKRYKKKTKPVSVPEPEKKSNIIHNVDCNRMWCPKCGAWGQEYMRVEALAYHYYDIDEVTTDGYTEWGEEVNYEGVSSNIFCNSCNASELAPEDIYEFSVRVQEATDPDEGDYLEVAQRLATEDRMAELPF